MNPSNKKVDISGLVAFIIMLILILIIQTLTSCSEKEPILTVYDIDVRKNCESCEVYVLNNSEKLVHLEVDPHQDSFQFEAVSGDTVNILVNNIPTGFNNNIYLRVNGSVTIKSEKGTEFYDFEKYGIRRFDVIMK